VLDSARNGQPTALQSRLSYSDHSVAGVNGDYHESAARGLKGVNLDVRNSHVMPPQPKWPAYCGCRAFEGTRIVVTTFDKRLRPLLGYRCVDTFY
jgi:hypothetical protein